MSEQIVYPGECLVLLRRECILAVVGWSVFQRCCQFQLVYTLSCFLIDLCLLPVRFVQLSPHFAAEEACLGSESAPRFEHGLVRLRGHEKQLAQLLCHFVYWKKALFQALPSFKIISCCKTLFSMLNYLSHPTSIAHSLW